jgi:hypothetical protein
MNPYLGPNPNVSAISSAETCNEAPSTRINLTITPSTPGPGLCNTDGTVAPGTYNLTVLPGFPSTLTFVRWDCYNTSTGTAGSATITTSWTLAFNQAATCVAIFLNTGGSQVVSPVPSPSPEPPSPSPEPPSPSPSPAPVQPKLALMSQYLQFGPSGYTGPTAALAANGSNTLTYCSEDPSTKYAPEVAGGPTPLNPGGGWCFGDGSVPADTYVLSKGLDPNGTRFNRWECYNTTSSTAVGPTVTTSWSLVGNQTATCVAIYLPKSETPGASPVPSPSPGVCSGDTPCYLYGLGGACADFTCECNADGNYTVKYCGQVSCLMMSRSNHMVHVNSRGIAVHAVWYVVHCKANCLLTYSHMLQTLNGPSESAEAFLS